MASLIIKLDTDKYVEWSTVVDAPTTSVMSLTELEKFLYETHGAKEGLFKEADPKTKALKEELVTLQVKNRLERLAENGTSSLIPGDSASAYLDHNRAGPKETCISVAEIVELYTYAPEKKGKFPFS